jgi:FG-GAP-like repeat
VASSAPAPAPSFAAPKEYGTGEGPDGLASGDLKGDGKPDLVTANGKAISVLLNSGEGSFQARHDYRAPGDALAIGDLNGDGKLDLATAAAVLRKPRVSVLLNRGDGRFRAKRDYRTGRGPNSVAIGDLNGDRKLDLATANTYQPPNSKAYTLPYFSTEVGAASRPRATTTLEITLGALGDLNSDRKLDLVTANEGNTISVLLNRGGGSFRAKRDYRTGPGPTDVAIGDLSADGVP